MHYSAQQLQDEIRRVAAQFPATGADAPVFSAAKRWEFLARLSLSGSVADTCRMSGVKQSTAYGYRREHPDFAVLWDDALREALGRMETEAGRRAVDGTDKPVFHKGEEVGYIREYSDQLLMFLIRKHDASYNNTRSQVELSGPGGGPIAHADMTPQRRQQLVNAILASADADRTQVTDVDPLS